MNGMQNRRRKRENVIQIDEKYAHIVAVYCITSKRKWMAQMDDEGLTRTRCSPHPYSTRHKTQAFRTIDEIGKCDNLSFTYCIHIYAVLIREGGEMNKHVKTTQKHFLNHKHRAYT